jgi:hypothetical protein
MSNRIHRDRFRRFERLEDRRVLAADPVISEFLAINNSSIQDIDGAFSDWIEIHNPGDTSHNLDGWYLTDNAAELRKWRFPAVEIGPRGYLVVFASNQNRKDPAAELHTNFRLDGTGEFLALVQPDGLTTTTVFDPFPIQVADVAYGLGTLEESTTLVGQQANASIHIPNATTGPLLAQTWTAADYATGSNGETWTVAQTGIGYDVDNQYDALFGSGGDIESQMRNVNPGAYIRIPFAVDDPSQLDRLTLRMRYEDGFTAYLNGEEVVTRNVGSVAVQPQNMIALYRFDEAAGTTAADSTGRSAAGNLVNFPGDGSQWTTGRVGRALEFRGGASSDHVVVPSYPKPASSISASAWVWADSRPTWGSIIKNWGNATAGQFHFGLNASDGRLSNYLDAASAVAIAPTQFPIGSWEHVAFVADASAGQMTIYHDGVAVVSAAYDGALLNSVMNSIGIGVKTNDAGTAPDSGSPGYWDGKLDEVALWNSALAPAEVLAIYAGGLQGVGLATSGGAGGQTSWNAAATSDRPDAQAVQFETFDLTGARGLLNPGMNLLAIHGVNVAANDADFLVAPEITAETATVDPETRQYITVLTPGGANSTGVATLGPIISQVSHTSLPPEVITTPLVGVSSPHAVFVPTSSALGDEWLQPQYALGTHGESWTSGTGGIGFDDDGSFAGLIDTHIGPAMHSVNSSVFVRSSFSLADPAIAERLKLRMSYDDGFVAYLNGVEVARANAPASPVKSGLVSYYDFDNNTSDRAGLYANNSGTAIDNLTPQAGTIRYVAGKRGQAVALNADLDGAAPDDIRRLDTAASSDVQMPAAYSVEAWINPTTLNGTGRIVANFALSFQYRLELQSGNRLALVHRQSNGTIVTALSPVGAVVAGQWQHVAGVADGTTLRAYVNGVEVAQLPYNGTVTNANEPLGIGDRPGRNDGVAQQYEGYLDEVALWEVPLSPAEILAHFQADSAGYSLTPNPPPGLSFQAAATGGRSDSQSAAPQEFDLTNFRNLLVSGENVLAIHGLNLAASDGDFLIRPELIAESGHPTQGQTLVTAVVHDALAPVQSVGLRYRVMYGAEQSLPMADDGLHGDGTAGDGIYGAKIPGGVAAPGQMLRWYVTATDHGANSSRNPLFASATESPEYYGTVVSDPAIATPLSVLHWFVANPALAETGTGTRASVFYHGEFYDNVFVRIRGETARSWPKKSYKFDFHRGYHFRYRDDVPRVEEFNLNATYTDKSYIRQLLSYEAMRDAGVPYSEAFPLHVRQNDAFFSVAHFVEQPDEEYLQRNGLDDEGALYKISYVGNNVGLSSTGGAEKRNRREEDFSDLQALVAGLAQSGGALHNYLFDHINLAEVINYMAANVVIQNIDRTVKNFYVYRDTTGTGEWQMFPWDVDLAFGPNALNTDVIEAADDTPNQHTSHPFFGGTQFPYTGLMNRLLDAVYQNPVTREMYLRRLRSLMDQLLNASSTPLAERYFESRIDELVTLLSADVTADRAKWGANAHFGGTTYTLQQAADRIKNEYLAPRRTHLFQTHATTSLPDPPVTILPSGAAAKALVPTSGALGLSWTQVGFSDGDWISGTTGVGYDEDVTYLPLLGLNLRDASIPAEKRIDTNGDNTNENDSVYLRIPFTSPDPASLTRLTLRMKYDDAFVAYINGVEVARSTNVPAGLTWNSAATGIHDDGAAVVFQDFDVTTHAGVLNTGPGNVLAIHLLNDATNGAGASTDMLLIPELVSGTPSSTSQVGIPGAQVGNPVIEFAAIEFAPASGNQDEEFIQLYNPQPFAVDVTGWKLTGGIEHVFTPGTVIPAGQSLYVVSDAAAFRARTTGPSGGQGLFVQGNYQGHLSNFGETIDLVAADDSVVATTTTPSVPSAAQRYLRITEVMYHPLNPQPQEIALGFADQDDFEYIELSNISDATTPTTLDLTGVRFSDGLSFSFAAAANASLSPGERILIGRSAAALAARYGAGPRVAGEFVIGEGLDNGGEPLKLEDAEGGTIHEFDYEDDWYPSTDGSGHSLVAVDPLQGLDAWDGKNGWRESFSVGGSPGEPDLMPGDANGDEQVDRLDLEILQAHVGLLSAGARQQGDFNADGAINRLDAAILANNFGRSYAPPTQPPTPAPSAAPASGIAQRAGRAGEIRGIPASRARVPLRRLVAAAPVDTLMTTLGNDTAVTLRATGRRTG